MDLINIPAGVPHGVRNCGFEDVEMIWLHDGVEEKGVTVYCETEEDVRNAPGKGPITVISLKDLEPCWSLPRAKEPEFLRWSINWIGGPSGFRNLNRGLAVESEKIAVGLTVLMPGHKQPSHTQEHVSETYVIVKGKAVVNLGEGTTEVGYLDGLYFPPGRAHSLRNHGTEPAYIVWAHGKANPISATLYQGETSTHCNGNGNGAV
jgi:mannose-6-phosphate isomerase-like protein (cupin superfamily)